jgi:hypothetical protein
MTLALTTSDDSDDQIVSNDSYIFEDNYLSCYGHNSDSEIRVEDIFHQSCKANNIVYIRRSAARMNMKKKPSLGSNTLREQKEEEGCYQLMVNTVLTEVQFSPKTCCRHSG